MSRIKIDDTGKKYGYLTILKYLKPGHKNLGPIWMARCDCGQVKEVRIREVRRGKIKSCGKCYLTTKIRSEGMRRGARFVKAERVRYSQAAMRAEKAGIQFNLSSEEYLRAVRKGSCFVCGARQSKLLTRMSPDEGYVGENIKGICGVCSSYIGRTSTVQEYLTHILRILQHHPEIALSIQTDKST